MAASALAFLIIFRGFRARATAVGAAFGSVRLRRVRGIRLDQTITPGVGTCDLIHERPLPMHGPNLP